MLPNFTKGPPSRVGRTKKFLQQKLLSIYDFGKYNFLGGIGYLEGAQEALDLPPAVVPTGIDLARSD